MRTVLVFLSLGFSNMFTVLLSVGFLLFVSPAMLAVSAEDYYNRVLTCLQ